MATDRAKALLRTWDRLGVIDNEETRIVRALVADNQRLRDDFAHLYDAVDKAQQIDNTGGDSAVSVVLWSWAERRAAVSEGATDA